MFNSHEYFSRINLTKEEITLDVSGLRKIYLAHLHTFTFENIDCLLGNEIKLDLDSLYSKIILNKRGGYCFELNLFFHAALKELGFDAEIYLARVFYRGTGVNAKTHLTVIVSIENEKYIADAGFGGPGPEDLLKFELDTIQKLFNYNFKIIEDQEFGYMVQRETDSIFKNVFAFEFDKVYPADLEMSNFYVSNLPTSAFLNNINICQFNKLGRKSIFNDNFNNFEYQKLTTNKINTFIDFKNVLIDEFKFDFKETEWQILENKFNAFKTK